MNKLNYMLKSLLSITILLLIISCGTNTKSAEVTSMESAEVTSMEIFKEYARQNGDKNITVPTITDYKNIYIEDIDNKNIKDANSVIAGATEDAVARPTYIQRLLFESGIISVIPNDESNQLSENNESNQLSENNESNQLSENNESNQLSENNESIKVQEAIASINLTYEKEEIVFSLLGDKVLNIKENDDTKVDENGTFKDKKYKIATINGGLVYEEDEIKKLITTDCNVDVNTTGVYECKYTLTYKEEAYTLIRLVIVGDASYITSDTNSSNSDTQNTIDSNDDNKSDTNGNDSNVPNATDDSKDDKNDTNSGVNSDNIFGDGESGNNNSEPSETPIPEGTTKLTFNDIDIILKYNGDFKEDQTIAVEAGNSYKEPGVQFYDKKNDKNFYVISIKREITSTDENGTVTILGYRSENELSYSARNKKAGDTKGRVMLLNDSGEDISSVFWNKYRILNGASNGSRIDIISEGTLTIPYVVLYNGSEILRVERNIIIEDTQAPRIIFPENITFSNENQSFALSVHESRGVIYSWEGEGKEHFNIDKYGAITLTDSYENGEYTIKITATERDVPVGENARSSDINVTMKIDIK